MVWGIMLLALCATSCSSKKFLQEGEHLITKNDIRVEGKHLTSAEKSRLKELASTRIPLAPNSNYFFFIPKERSSLKHRMAADTHWTAALMMDLDGEVPSLIDSSRIADISKNLQNTLESEGYYDAEVSYGITYKNKTAVVRYDLFPNKIYRLDSFDTKCRDTALLTVIHNLNSKSLLVKGTPVSADLRANEAKRVADELRNLGYFDITPAQFSRFLASDTTDHEVDLDFLIYSTGQDSLFKKYTIGEIYIYPNFSSDNIFATYQDTIIDGFHFLTIDGNTVMKPKFIAQKMAIHSGDFYTYKDYRKTILQLNTLDIFKTPRINIQKRDDTSNILDYHIQLTKEKKIQDDMGIEVFNSSLSNNQVLFGISLRGGRRIKNVFGGSETFAINLDGSSETAFSGTSSGNITTVGIGLDIFTPRYRDWLSLGGIRLFPYFGKRIFSDLFMEDLSALGEQFFTVSFNYEDFQNFYSSTNIKLSRGVNLTRANHKYNFVFQNIDLLSPVEGPDFAIFVQDNPIFRESFKKQLVTGFIFRSFNYAYNSPIKNNKAYDLFFGIETSGVELSLVNAFTKGQTTSFKFNGDTIEFSQFIKAELEPKFTYYINRKSSLAFRLGVGIVIPFGEGDEIPYNELFSLGGSYSLRGWRNREVGPGFQPLSSAVTPFQADQFKLELSSEYRFDLGWIIEGALFAEAGNIWSLKRAQNTDKPWQNYAFDAGLGVRFDLTFFLFRFDMAFPLRNWYPDADDGKYWNLRSFQDATSNPHFSIGINYPF